MSYPHFPILSVLKAFDLVHFLFCQTHLWNISEEVRSSLSGVKWHFRVYYYMCNLNKLNHKQLIPFLTFNWSLVDFTFDLRYLRPIRWLFFQTSSKYFDIFHTKTFWKQKGTRPYRIHWYAPEVVPEKKKKIKKIVEKISVNRAQIVWNI